MVVVIPGALEDSKNISEKEYYKKWGQSKTDHVYGDPMSFIAEKEPSKDMSQGFWGTLFSGVSSSSIVSFIRYQLALGGPRDPNFSINEENIMGYEDHLGFLLQANSETELNNIKKTIDAVRLNQQVVASANGFLGTTGSIIGGFIDPTILLSGGIAGAGIKTIAATAKGINWVQKASVFAKNVIADKFGKDFAASAGGVMLKGFGSGVLGGAATGAIDVGIDSLVEDVDSEDALSKIAWFSIFGGGIGLLVGANKGTQMAIQRKRADKLIKAINTKNPNKIVLTDAEFQKAVNNPDFINSKIKSALGMENLQTSPDIRGNLSPSNVVKSVMNTLVDNPFVLINESSGKTIVVNPSVESVASSMVAENLFKLQKNINNYYSKWLQEKYSNTGIAKLKAFKDLKVWAGGKDYEAFLQELSNESFTPGSTSSTAIRELANKNYNEIIKPLADYGMKYDLWGYKVNDLFKIEQEIKAIGKIEANPKDLINGKLPKELEQKKAKLKELQNKREEILKKEYTQEDFEGLPKGERYFPRRFDAIKVGLNEKGAVNAIKNGFWSESKYRDLKNIPEKELTVAQKKVLLEEDNRLSEAAQDVVNKILHREDKGVVKNPRKTRGSERPRNLTFSTKYIEDYMIQDPMNALRDYTRTVITDTELLKRFGTLNLNELINAIENDYEGLIKNSVSEKQKKILNTRKEKDLEDIRCVWCRVRGIKEYSAEDLTEWGRAFNHGANIINNLNVARLIGGTVISATSDLAQACMTVGFKNFFKGVSKWFNKDFREAFRGEEDTWLRAIDHFKNTRQLGFYNQMIDSGVLAAVDNFSGKLADLSVKMSMITKWDELNKFIIGYVTQERVLKIGEKLLKKSKISIKDSEWLATTGITEENATKIFEQFKKYGRITDGGIWESSVGFWDNNKLKDIFRGAVKKIQNQAVLTPTAGSVPRGFDVSFLKPILQFKRFTFSAYSKCMIPTLQKRDLNAFAGITMMMSIGIMKAYLRALKSGYVISMADAVKTSLKEAEVGSYFGDAYGLLSNFAGLNGKKNQTSQQFMRDMFGTGYDFITTFHDGSLGLSKLITGLGGEMSYGQIHNVRKMLPLQNNIFLSKLFDAFEASEIDKRGTKRAKKIFYEKKKQK